MRSPTPRLTGLLALLRRQHGAQPEPPPRTAFEHVLWEKVAYLSTDERRADAFALLARSIGLTPEAIAAAPRARLVDVFATGGIQAVERANNAIDAAQYVVGELDGSLDRACALPVADAVKRLTRVRGIAQPGAERILLFTRSHSVLGLESNGLRVVQRLGYGAPARSYAAGYRSATQAAARELSADCDTLVEAHLLLRRHGQTICKSSAPKCGACALEADCPAAPAKPSES